MLRLQDSLSYEFGDFRLDAGQRCLWRDGEMVSLTPKAIDTLIVLVRERGHVVGKETLLSEVWPDTFVEEATLAQNIFTLRKTLGLSAGGGQYIETIPRRGYRFAAEVRSAGASGDLLIIEQHTRTQTYAAENSDSPDVATPAATKSRRLVVGAGVMAVAVALVLGVWAVGTRWRRGATLFANSFRQVEMIKLTDSGQARRFALAPDGQYIAQAIAEGGRQRLVLRQANGSHTVEIVPAAAVEYLGLTFSRDGGHIFYVARAPETREGILYQVPTLGGMPRQILRDVDSPVTFAPDGQQFAFVRGFPEQRESALMLARSDGSNERKLAVRPWRERFSPDGPAWSPDGQILACAVSNNSQDSSYMSVITVSTDDGRQQPLSAQRWTWAGQVTWLPDSSGVALPAWEENSVIMPDQLWLLSYPDGAARRVTVGVSGFYGAALAADGRRLVTLQSYRASNFWVATEGTPPARITHGAGDNFGARLGLTWTPDNRLLYASNATGQSDIWTMNPDGSQPKQLTNDPESDLQPKMSADGRYIVFVSYRGGIRKLWRMNADGSQPQPLTHVSGDDAPALSPDGQWVYYLSLNRDRPTLWRIGSNGGTPAQLTDRYTGPPAISPDGKTIACFFPDANSRRLRLSLLSASDGSVIRQFDLTSDPYTPHIAWHGNALAYLKSEAGVSNIWLQPLDGSPPKPFTNFQEDLLFRFAFSPDGKQLAYERGRDIDDLIMVRDSGRSANDER